MREMEWCSKNICVYYETGPVLWRIYARLGQAEWDNKTIQYVSTKTGNISFYFFFIFIVYHGQKRFKQQYGVFKTLLHIQIQSEAMHHTNNIVVPSISMCYISPMFDAVLRIRRDTRVRQPVTTKRQMNSELV